MDKIIKSISTKAEKREDRILRFIGSSEDVDRDLDKIMVDGWDLKNYRKNPVVLFGHDQRSEAVARTKKVWVDKIKKQLLFDIEFPEAEVSSKGDSLYKLYKNGFMFATSVSFLPNFEKVSYPERKNGKGPSRIFGEQELTEISLVSVPANARALLTSKSMDEAINNNIVCKEEVDELLEAFGKIEKTPAAKEETEMDYEAEIKILKAEMEELKSGSLYSIFDKEEDSELDKVYDTIMEEKSVKNEDHEIMIQEAIDALKQ